MDRQKKLDFIRSHLVSSADTCKILGISRTRLSELTQTGKLEPVIRGFYLKDDVELRLKEQDDLRKKFGGGK